MDFDKLIRDLVAQGATIEELGKQFADAANRVEAANNSKKKRDKYLTDTRRVADRAYALGEFTFEVAAAAATLATAEAYPDMTIDELKEYQDATCTALQETAKLQYTLSHKMESEDDISALLEALFTPFSKEEKDESDDEKISRFLRKLG